MRCQMCKEEITILPTDPVVEFNRLVNHLFVVHTWPDIEAMLRAHADGTT